MAPFMPMLKSLRQELPQVQGQPGRRQGLYQTRVYVSFVTGELWRSEGAMGRGDRLNVYDAFLGHWFILTKYQFHIHTCIHICVCRCAHTYTHMTFTCFFYSCTNLLSVVVIKPWPKPTWGRNTFNIQRSCGRSWSREHKGTLTAYWLVSPVACPASFLI